MPEILYPRRITRPINVGSVVIGGENPIVIQSMTATKTRDVVTTAAQVNQLERAGAGLVRIAVDSKEDAKALAEIRALTSANLSVDLQENWDNLVGLVAPYTQEIRYNPGHLYHHQRSKPVIDKLAFIAETADRYNCAIRVGVNCGSVDPELAHKFGADSTTAMVESGLMHADLLDNKLGFRRFNVSLKDSDPAKVVEGNRRFAALRPDIPLHLGVTEAGLPPIGVIKTRIAFEELLSAGIGETLRVSLTVPNELKHQEIEVGRQIVEDIGKGKFLSESARHQDGPNVISCPSCSRVENGKFVELAQEVNAIVTEVAKGRNITIAVMGCRVNGPGETDDADLGVWCDPNFVNLKRGSETVGTFTYEEIVPRLLMEVNNLS